MHRNKLSLICFTAVCIVRYGKSVNAGLRGFLFRSKKTFQVAYASGTKKKNFGNFFLENKIQSTLVISSSVISNNRLSRRENLVLVLTQKSKLRLQNIVEKRRNCSWGAISPLFHNIFNIYF